MENVLATHPRTIWSGQPPLPLIRCPKDNPSPRGSTTSEEMNSVPSIEAGVHVCILGYSAHTWRRESVLQSEDESGKEKRVKITG